MSSRFFASAKNANTCSRGSSSVSSRLRICSAIHNYTAENEDQILFIRFQILFRDRSFGRFGLPIYVDHPPAFAVVHELKAVDAADERLFVILFMERQIGRKHLCDVAVLIDVASMLAFVKAVLLEHRAAARYVFLRRQKPRALNAG